MRMGMQSLQICKLRWGEKSHRSSGSRVPDPERQPKRECPAGVRPEIRAPLFRLPRILAHAELFRPEIQRQWLPVNERPGRPDLAKRLLLAYHVAHYSLLESRERQQRCSRQFPGTGETKITTTGFNLTGLDILTGGTLEKNISFLLVPFSDETGAFHFESANVRFDNLFHSPWMNVKVGKFELDSFISEKTHL